jgi:hypothetical protein
MAIISVSRPGINLYTGEYLKIWAPNKRSTSAIL